MESGHFVLCCNSVTQCYIVGNDGSPFRRNELNVPHAMRILGHGGVSQPAMLYALATQQFFRLGFGKRDESLDEAIPIALGKMSIGRLHANFLIKTEKGRKIPATVKFLTFPQDLSIFLYFCPNAIG